MRKLKQILAAMVADGKIESIWEVGQRAGLPKTTWFAYLSNSREIKLRTFMAVERVVRELGIVEPWAVLNATVADNDRTEHYRTIHVQERTHIHDQRAKRERRNLMLSPAARAHFGLARDPFSQDLRDVDGVFLGSVHRGVFDLLLDAAKYEKFAGLIAPVGWGKTIIRKLLVERLHELGYQVCTVQQLDREELTITRVMDALLRDFAGRRVGSMNREAATREVKAMLEGLNAQGKRSVLMIDEAHALNPSTLRGLKRLYEIEDGFIKLLGIVLFGQPQLYRRLGGPDLEEVSARVQIVMAYGLDTTARQGKLGPEPKRVKGRKSCVPEYITMKLTRAGAREPGRIIEPLAMDAIAKVTDVPLRINDLCVRALNLAFELNYPGVTVDKVLNELQGEG